jgi:hypothetical protein
MNTTKMNESLRVELVRLGWKPDNVTWGRRVHGDVHGVTIERDGVERYYAGPFWAIKHRSGQMAIVRWG